MIKKDLMIGIVILVVIAIINSQEVAENVMPSSVEPSIIIQSVSPQVVPELKVQQNIINKPQNTQKTQNINTSSQTIQKEQQPILTSQSNITANNTPTNQISPKRNELVDQTIDHLANLSKLHQQAMLQQVNILHKIHQNPSLSLQNLANTTQDQMLDAERKFAHQSRLNYEKVKRQIEQNQLRIRKQDQQLLRSAKLTKTNQFKLQQKTTFQDTYNKWRDTQTNHNLSDYMFSITKDRTEDFMVMLPVDQIIYVTIAIYVNKNGVYSRTVDIQDEGPVHVLIYENNNRIIEEKQVYFQSNFYIQGKQNKIYTIKFNNYDIDRLIAFSISVLLQHNHVSQVISAHDVSNHDDRVDSVLQDIQTRFNALNDIETLQYTNIETLKQRIAQYYNYAIVQTIIIIIFGFIQVQLMSRLLKKSSVI